MPDATEGRRIGSFLTGLLAGTFGRLDASGIFKNHVLDAGPLTDDSWQIEVESGAGHRYAIEIRHLPDPPSLEEKGTRTADGITGTLYGPPGLPSPLREEEPGWYEVKPNDLEDPEVH